MILIVSPQLSVHVEKALTVSSSLSFTQTAMPAALVNVAVGRGSTKSLQLLIMACKQARSLLGDAGGSDSSAVGAPLSLKNMCHCADNT